MNWNEWYKYYDKLPSLQERLRIVREQIIAALNECPPGQIRIVSVCAGDGRDLISALQNHPRRNDVTALLLDNNAESVARGHAAAENTGLQLQLRFLDADATVAKNYLGAVPAGLVLLSGFLGHLRHADVPRLIHCLPMFCQTGGWVIWNRHLFLHNGHEQVPAIRTCFRQTKFQEAFFAAPDPNGFAVGRVQFTGRPEPLDPSRVLFEFVGLDRLLSAPPALPEAKPKAVNATETIWTSRTETLESAETTIPARFGEMARVYPLRTALGGSAWQPTYAELNSTANRLAHAISSRHGKPGDRVALLMRHDSPLMAAALAVLKAGRIVVVLNPTDPPVHLKQILDDAQARVVVADSPNLELAEQIAQKERGCLCFENEILGPELSPEATIAPTDIAWLIYTSGSTGRPKGVMQTHRNIVHNVSRLSRGMNLTAEDRILLLGSPSGGQGTATAWCALLNGAALFPFPIAEKGASALKNWMLENEISVFVSSASVFRAFAQSLEETDFFQDIRLVRLGSEAATANDLTSFKRHFPDKCVLLNSFSSSETGNITQQPFAKSDEMAEGRLPVGWPATGMEVLLLDESGQAVRDGEVGEIVVKSRYLSPGYWQNESLTAERFSAGPIPGDGRIFHSGDLGRRTADGPLIFLGRKDTRVKVHGYRIELSEIEDALSHQPEVRDAVVCARETPNHDTQLVACVILRPGASCTAETLRRALRSTLPGYMVPGHFVFLEKFPLSPHGKIDRRALALLPRTVKSAASKGPMPRYNIEQKLAQIWREALNIPAIGRQHDFFDLGGTSLQSAQVLTKIEEAFNVILPAATLAEHSTIEALALLLAERTISQSDNPLVVLRRATTGRPLFFMHNGMGEVSTYGQLARRLPGRPLYALQARGLHGEGWPILRIPDMVRFYLPAVIAADPTGPYLLAGTCAGAVVAFEMAQQLVQSGRSVGLVALFDSPTPPFSGQRSRWSELTTDRVRDAFRILRWSILCLTGLQRTPRWLPAYRHFVSSMTARAWHVYRPVLYPGKLTLFLTAAKYPKEDRRALMAKYAREAQTITIPGNRAGMFVPPAVDELARQLQVCLDRAEGKDEP